jgi:hypothetical protein
MKTLAVALMTVCIVGCATRPAYQPQTQRLTYTQLAALKVDDVNCPDIDYIIPRLEDQLRMRNLLGVNPESMTEEDREYNSKARVIIWSLRIGCNNPARYKKK